MKCPCKMEPVTLAVSSPSRGTWIEMPEGREITTVFTGRPPHGGRGLK